MEVFGSVWHIWLLVLPFKEYPPNHIQHISSSTFAAGHHYHWETTSNRTPLPTLGLVLYCTSLSGCVPSMPGGLCRPQLRQRTGERDVSPWESPLTASDDGWPDYGVLFTHTQFTSHWAARSGRAAVHTHSLPAGHVHSHTHILTHMHAPVCAHVHMYGTARVHR